LLHTKEMTKKRYKFNLALAGILAACFVVIFSLLFASTHASADKNSGTTHRHVGHPAPGGDSGQNHPGHSPLDEPHGVNWIAPEGQSGDCAQGPGQCSDPGQGPDPQDYQGQGSEADAHAHEQDADQHGGQGSGSPPAGGYFAGGNPPFGSFGSGPFGPGGSGSGDENSGPGNHDGDSKDGPKGDTGGDPGDEAPIIKKILTLHDDPHDNPPGDGPPDFDPPGPNFLPDTPPDAPHEETRPVPEPMTLSLFAGGLIGSLALRRRSKAKSAL
jgi:hypothetical protein